MEKSERRTTQMPREQGRRFPQKHKIPPSGQDYTLKLASAVAGKHLSFTLAGSADSRALKVTFSGKEKATEEYFGERIEARDKDGEVVAHFILNFGIYGDERTYELPTPLPGVNLILKRGADGDLTFWAGSKDISGSKTSADEKRKYVTVHSVNGETIGYTIKDFLHRINLSFGNIACEIPA